MRAASSRRSAPGSKQGLAALTEASTAIGMSAMNDLGRAFAGSVPYLRLWGIVAGGWQMARAAQIAAAKIAAGDPDAEFYRAKLATARYYADAILCNASALTHQIVHGSAGVAALSEDDFELDRRTATAAGAR